MRKIFLTGAALVLMTGFAAAQTTSGQSSDTGMSHNENAPAMPSSTKTMPKQRQSTMRSTMGTSHSTSEAGSNAVQHSGASSQQ